MNLVRVAAKRVGIVAGIMVISAVAAIIFLPVIFAGLGIIPERGDWRYEALPGGCVVCRNNNRDIHLSRGDTEVLVSDYLSYVSWTEDVIFAQQVNLPEQWNSFMDGVNGLAPVYYIVPAEGAALGPYESAEEFEHACISMGVIPPREWIRTTDLSQQMG